MPEETIPEIVVTGKRPPPRRRPPSGSGSSGGRGGAGGGLATLPALARSQLLNVGRTVAQVADPIFDAATIARFNADLMATEVIPEIVVTGRRLSTATAFASRLGFPALVAEGAARLGSAIARELQRQAIDEMMEFLLAPVTRPDTPLRTITVAEPIFDAATEARFNADMMATELMPEIVVTAQRPRTQSNLSSLIRSQQLNLSRTQTQTRTGTRTQTQTRTRTLPLTLSRAMTGTRRSTLLGIGTAASTGLATGLASGLGTGATTATSAITQSKLSQITRRGQKTKECRKKKPKPRTKCFRQLVKQGRTESRDKISKWARIDCDTGRTLEELI